MALPPCSGRLRFFITPLLCFLLAALAGEFGDWMSGGGQGVFFAGFVIATLLAPVPHCARAAFAQLGSLLALVCGIGAIWTWAAIRSDIPPAPLLAALLLLLLYGLFLGTLIHLLHRAAMSLIGSCAAVITLSLIWLAWPLWSAPYLTSPQREARAQALINIHPLMVVDGLMIETFPIPWMQRPLAYALGNLGDDIPYSVPHGILPAALTYAAAALLMVILAWGSARWRSARLGAGVGQVGDAVDAPIDEPD